MMGEGTYRLIRTERDETRREKNCQQVLERGPGRYTSPRSCLGKKDRSVTRGSRIMDARGFSATLPRYLDHTSRGGSKGPRGRIKYQSTR